MHIPDSLEDNMLHCIDGCGLVAVIMSFLLVLGLSPSKRHWATDNLILLKHGWTSAAFYRWGN